MKIKIKQIKSRETLEYIGNKLFSKEQIKQLEEIE